MPISIPPPRPNEFAEPKSVWDRITDATSVGIAWSLLLHTLLLIVMAIVILPSVGDGETVAIVATEADDDANSFDNMAAVEFDTAGAEQSESESIVELTPEVADIPLAIATEVQQKATSEASSKGSGESVGEGRGEPRMRAPANAVRRGRFAAWTVPIKQAGFPEPKAGDSPRPGQSYNIVIQLELPESIKRYTAGDLTGTVVGTDGYRLRLPNRTYFFNEDGDLVEANSRRRLPVIDHKVQVLVHVPAAKYEAVRDRITVASKKLAESQTLELVFTGEGRRRRF